VKVLYNEDLANHVSPESCGGSGNTAAEALTGENAGGLLSSEITEFRVPTFCTDREGHTTNSDICELLCDPAEHVEGRALTKRNTMETTAARTQGRLTASYGLDGVRRKAEEEKDVRFTALLHHVTPLLLKRSYMGLKRKAASGIDNETWDDYYIDHVNRIDALHERLHKGSYRAQPVRRTYIKKEDGKQRPLGVTALEDKIVQQAVHIVLSQIYENDFMGFSYGFRPRRSQHDALDALYVGINKRKINWILDADIQGFFDNLSHEWLVKFLETRIRDKRILRLIKKWLKTGYIEGGKRVPQTLGTPQGSVISPLLANVFLHYALDVWAAQWRKSRIKGDMIIVRYADDFVMGFQNRSEAVNFRAALETRLTEYGLTLHPKIWALFWPGRFLVPVLMMSAWAAATLQFRESLSSL